MEEEEEEIALTGWNETWCSRELHIGSTVASVSEFERGREEKREKREEDSLLFSISLSSTTQPEYSQPFTIHSN